MTWLVKAMRFLGDLKARATGIWPCYRASFPSQLSESEWRRLAAYGVLNKTHRYGTAMDRMRENLPRTD
jgi:hypothetical protein